MLRVFYNLGLLSELCVSSLSWEASTTFNKKDVLWANHYWHQLTNRGLDKTVNEAFKNDAPNGTANGPSLCHKLYEELTVAKLTHQMNLPRNDQAPVLLTADDLLPNTDDLFFSY